ncbi:MAG: LCP family protein [Firmicutes bacterium]|nr:LCP family protein [Bacillota bacterium]
MYRERDYNRDKKNRSVAEEEFWGEMTESSAPKRPKVTKGESVFEERRPKRQDYYEEEVPRRRSVRDIPPRKRNDYQEDDYYEDAFPESDYSQEELYVEPSLFHRKEKKQTHKQVNFPQKSRKQKKERRRKKHPLLVLLGIFLVVFLAFWFYLTANLNSHPLPRDNESLGITDNGKIGVTNIALFGVDARDDSDTGRSDAMMVVSVDLIRGDLKMISLLRDTKVPIEGHGETKLNHAYAYGGPELAVKTINQNFDLDIKEFVTVNFNELAAVVDAVGGVTLEVSEEERQQINYNMIETAPDHPKVESSGYVLLDGTQAVAYSRIRSIDSDNARTDRQQEVLNGVFASVQTMGPLQFPKFVHDFSEIVDTSLSSLNVLKLAPILLRNPELERYTIPDAEYETDLWGGIDSSGMWCWHYDLDAAAARLHSIIYGE